MTKTKNLEILMEKANSIIGFGAVEKYGCKLSKKEIKIIADYAKARGANRKYVVSILENRGRPFDISDPAFNEKCLICHALNNYCCC